MANIVAITVKDGAATPKDRVFTPNRGENNTVQYVELSATGLLKGRPTLEIKVKPLGQGGRTTQAVHQKMVVPVVVTETINGVQVEKILGYNSREIIDTFSPVSNEQDRKNLRVMSTNLQNSPTVVALVEKAESFVQAGS